MAFKSIIRSHRAWVVLICAFVVWITFIDSDNLLDRWELKQRINDLEKQRSYFQERITEDSTLLKKLETDEYLEHYARENFMMKRDGETLFLIEE